MDEWKRLEAEAKKLSDEDLVRAARKAARELVVLWREAESREHGSDFHLSVGILKDRIGIIVDGYRTRKMNVVD